MITSSYYLSNQIENAKNKGPGITKDKVVLAIKQQKYGKFICANEIHLVNLKVIVEQDGRALCADGHSSTKFRWRGEYLING